MADASEGVDFLAELQGSRQKLAEANLAAKKEKEWLAEAHAHEFLYLEREADGYVTAVRQYLSQGLRLPEQFAWLTRHPVTNAPVAFDNRSLKLPDRSSMPYSGRPKHSGVDWERDCRKITEPAHELWSSRYPRCNVMALDYKTELLYDNRGDGQIFFVHRENLTSGQKPGVLGLVSWLVYLANQQLPPPL